MSILSNVDRYGLYEIRMESIGGFGANLAGKMLSDIGQDYLNLNVKSFSSYGSEKKGSPVKAFIRFAEKGTQIRINNPIETPRVLVVFTDALLKNPDVLAGCTKDTVIIINTRKSEQEIIDIMNFPSYKLGLINATDIAMEEGVKSNGVLLGALAKSIDFLKLEFVEAIFKDVIGKKYPALLDANLKAIKRGYDSLTIKELKGKDDAIFPSFIRAGGIGYLNQPRGGVILNAGNAANKSNAAGRPGIAPMFNIEKCINCGMCNIVCSDQCIVWQEGVDKKTGKDSMNMVGVDYQYCKGCLKCVEICPVKALFEVKEKDYDLTQYSQSVLDKNSFVQNQK